MSHNREQVECVLDAHASLGESPVVSPEGPLYWADINLGELHRFNPTAETSRPDETWSIGEEIGCVALDADPKFVILALRNTICRFDTTTGERTRIAQAEYDPAMFRFNDGRCDPAGRLWVGTYNRGRLPEGGLYCLDLDGTLSKRVDRVTISNGLAWSPDGQTMYHAETTANTVYAYDYDPQTGQANEQRVFIDLTKSKELPDGAATDSEGNYWVAMYGSSKIVQFSPTGERMQEIQVPVPAPTMVAFGGEGRRTLYITSASQGYSAEEKARYPQAGGIFAAQVDIPGLPEHAFGSSLSS